MRNPSFRLAFFAAPFLLCLPALAQEVRVVQSPPRLTSSGYYTPNRAPLQGLPFQKLPPGAVVPHGWLRTQLQLDADGLSGRLPEISDYLKFEGNGWVDPNSNSGWEELGYWLRGYGDLSYVLKDPKMLAATQKWVDAIIANQKPDGYFGPDRMRPAADGGGDPWAHMLMLDVVHSNYEYTGNQRAFDFLTRFFKWQNAQPPKYFQSGWGALRWADNLNIVYWLYNHTGDANLLDLAKKIHDNSANYTNNLPNGHNVNLAQGIREPGEYWMQSGASTDLSAVENDYQKIMSQFGQVPGGGFGGDENTRPGYGDPRQGFETCGIVEYMHTHEMMTRISGDPLWADRAEELAFNSLPAALTPDHKGIHYITSPNLVEINRSGVKGQFDNHFPMLNYQPGIHNYRCCPHNYGMGWPYYAEESWLATSDKGVAASLYAASDVNVKVGDGTPVTWSETTDYPFSDTIQFKLATPKTTKFPLYLRIPRWSDGAEVKLNNKAVKVAATPLSYVVLDRDWKNGDTVSLRLPMQIDLTTWAANKNSMSVNYGPLSFALDSGEKWTRDGGTDEWPEYSVAPIGAWNYGLPTSVKATDFKIVRTKGALPGQPFTLENTPIRLETKARLVPGWTADTQGIVRPLQQSPARSTAPLQTLTLVPMGAARLRISSFPTVSTAPTALDWTLDAPKVPLYEANASFIHDDIEALVDGIEPKSSMGDGVPRFTWWDHKGSAEWAALDLKKPMKVSSVSLYWFDDTGKGQCRVPASWRLLYKDGTTWKPVEGATDFGTAPDKYNTVTFTPVTTSALRLEVQLQPDMSGGILEWKTDAKG
ncbi:hypothetical protein IAD21_02496 [Abditibacteriota bacterium]|nr:hypothetical protein IAD21_02496 [Abditibacteriota bacterium]